MYTLIPNNCYPRYLFQKKIGTWIPESMYKRMFLAALYIIGWKWKVRNFYQCYNEWIYYVIVMHWMNWACNGLDKVWKYWVKENRYKTNFFFCLYKV